MLNFRYEWLITHWLLIGNSLVTPHLVTQLLYQPLYIYKIYKIYTLKH